MKLSTTLWIPFLVSFIAWDFFAALMAMGIDGIPSRLLTHPHLLPLFVQDGLRTSLSGLLPRSSMFQSFWTWYALAALVFALVGWIVGVMIDRWRRHLGS
jgi:hypothetical protein